MSRTDLFHRLRRLLLEHRQARRLNLTLDQLREERDLSLVEKRTRFTLNRREFLAATGAAAASFAVPALARTATEQPKIIIVGAGISGLSCALALADKGLNASIYEASQRIGGRMFSNTAYWRDGQVSEWGGELIDTGHKTVRNLARRFGLKLDNLLNAEPNGSEDTYFFAGGYYPKREVDRDFAAILDALTADVDAAGYPTSYDSYTATGLMLDRMSIYDWIEARIPGGHRSRLGQLIDTAYNIEYGAETTEQSALNMLYLLGFQPNNSGMSMFGESDERFRIRGGNEQLPRAIAAHLGEERNIQLGMQLIKIKRTPNGRYTLTFDKNGTAVTVTTDYVVLALPFAVLRKIDYREAEFDECKQRAIQQLGRGHNGKLVMQFDQRYWQRAGAWPGVSNGASYADTGYQSTWDSSRAQPGASGMLTFYSGGKVASSMATQAAFAGINHAGVGQDVQRTLAQTEQVFPGLSSQWNGKATLSLPQRSRLFRASYAFYRVGQYTSFGGYEKTPQRNVFFCGEHTSTDFQGYMEGGAAEGLRVGQELAVKLKTYIRNLG